LFFDFYELPSTKVGGFRLRHPGLDSQIGIMFLEWFIDFGFQFCFLDRQVVLGNKFKVSQD